LKGYGSERIKKILKGYGSDRIKKDSEGSERIKKILKGYGKTNIKTPLKTRLTVIESPEEC